MANLVIYDRQRSNILKIRKYIEEANLEYTILGEVSSLELAEVIIKKGQVDLLIGDELSPKKTGLQLFHEYADLYPGLHMILFTEYNRFNTTKDSLQGGRVDYLFKPVRKNDVIKSLTHMHALIEGYKSRVAQASLLRSHFELNKESFLDRFFLNLIYGSFRKNDVIIDRLKHFKLPYKNPFTIAIFKVDHYRRYELAMDEEEQQFFIFKICQFLDNYLKLQEEGAAFITRYDEVTLYLSSPLEPTDLMIYLHDLHETCTQTLAIQATIGIGRTYRDSKKIHLSYKQAVDALLEHAYLGQNTLIHIDYVSGKNDLAYAFDPDQEAMIIKYLLSGQLEASLNRLRKVLETIGQMTDIDPKVYGAFCKKLLHHLIRDGLAYGYDFDEDLKKYNQYADINHVSDMADAYSHLSQIFRAAYQRIAQHVKEEDADLLNRAEAYVKEYYKHRISLTRAALFLKTTPKHLDDLLVAHFDKKFYDFCMMIRLEAAMDLLKSTHKNTQEVANEVGFNNTEYFTAIFKQFLGHSPQEYRHSTDPRMNTFSLRTISPYKEDGNK